MQKVAFVTGGARRIGQAIVRAFHKDGYDVIIHYHNSQKDAINLMNELNTIRSNSVDIIQANLNIINDTNTLDEFTVNAINLFGRIDVLIHNASSFYPTSFNDALDVWQSHWEDLFLTNAKAPLFLSYIFKDELMKNQGSIISLLDIHARDKPFAGYPIYNMAKSAHLAMVQSLALEVAPNVRVNGVSPGVNIFPDDDKNSSLNSSVQVYLTNSVPLKKIGTPDDIAQAVLFLANASYITGQVLAVDGGRSLTLLGG